MTAVDVDRLPLTEYLVLEVLAARHRLGETHRTFPRRAARAAERLADHGLVGWQRDSRPATIQAWLTDAGRAAVLYDGYRAPTRRLTSAEQVWLGERAAAIDALDDHEAHEIYAELAAAYSKLFLAGVSWRELGGATGCTAQRVQTTIRNAGLPVPRRPTGR